MRVGKLAFCGVLFCWAEVFSLMELHLLILLFLLVLLVSYPKKSLSRLVTGGFPLCFLLLSEYLQFHILHLSP